MNDGKFSTFERAGEAATKPAPARCPECGDRLTDRTQVNGWPSYCDTCDREVDVDELGNPIAADLGGGVE